MELIMITPEEILEEAKRATIFSGRTNFDPWKDTILLLRSKNWTYREIHQWMLAKGCPVNKDEGGFASACCKAVKRWRMEGKK